MNLVFLVIIVNFFFVNCLYSDFNTYYDTALKDNKIFESFRKIYLGIEMYFGKNEEKFIVELDINSFLTVIPGKEIIEKKAENIKKFDPTSSTSFKNIEKIGSVMTSGEKFYEGILGQDLIQFGDKEKIHDLKFAVANSYYLLNPHYYAFFGLKLINNNPDIAGYNLLQQLKKNKNINKQIWYLNFTDGEKGKFTIGKFPHEMNKKYDENYILSSYINKTNNLKYGLNFDEIFYGYLNNYQNRTTMKIHNSSAININTRLIICTYEFGDVIYNSFFGNKITKGICFMDQLEGEDKYKFFYCKKDKVDLTEMKNINFYIRDKNMTFVLEPKDLFYEYNGYLYYLIIYKQFNIDDGNKDFEWTFGTTFLKKYILTFDTEDKLVYYYSKLRDGNDDFISKNEEEEESNSNLKYIILIIILSVVFISSITFFLIYINKIKPRKKKANELDEEFEYNNKNEKKDEEENNDPLMINE